MLVFYYKIRIFQITVFSFRLLKSFHYKITLKQVLNQSCFLSSRCPDRMCSKPCVTLRAFKMHAKCVHKGVELTPNVQEAKANFICKVNNIESSYN